MKNILDYLKIFPNVFPKSATEILLRQPKIAKLARVNDYSKGTNILNDSYRVTDIVNIDEYISQNLILGLKDFWNCNLREYYDADIKNIEEPQLLRYNVGGKYNVHNDSEDCIDGKIIRLIPRDITILSYLNDEYEGGELEFPEYGISIKPKQNTVITFPSYYEFQHRVKPVTKGERFTLVTWIETEKRIYERSSINEMDICQ